MIKNSDETIRFFNELENAYGNISPEKLVFIDLNSVDEITPEVIVILISRLDEMNPQNQRLVYGNVPRNEIAQEMLAGSGFYDFVKSNVQSRKATKGVIKKCGNSYVDSQKAADLSEMIAGYMKMTVDQEDGHQATAIECMTNTREHASGNHSSRRGEKRWWFSVYCDTQNNVAKFAFVDTGIGIFESLKSRRFPLFASKKRSEILKSLLADISDRNSMKTKDRTSTGMDHRGNGLPNIARRNRLKQTHQLRIIINNMYADVENNQYQMMEQNFSGTIICWEHLANNN